MFHRILVPVDLTDKSLGAVDLARDLASHSDAEVILLHVIAVHIKSGQWGQTSINSGSGT
jgi:nucleotide-binding universal stress UspA family protein